MTMSDYATSSRHDPMAMAAPTATPSSSGSPETTGSKLTGILAGVDLDEWNPGDPDEAQAAVASVADFCRDYCPARLACVEGACRLYRLEGRALDALGYHRNPATESVGVVGQPLVGIL